MFQIGLMTARELPGREVAEALAAELARAARARGVDRATRSATATMLSCRPPCCRRPRAATSKCVWRPSKSSGRLGDASSVRRAAGNCQPTRTREVVAGREGGARSTTGR